MCMMMEVPAIMKLMIRAKLKCVFDDTEGRITESYEKLNISILQIEKNIIYSFRPPFTWR